jgi:hypothetical protein
MTKRMLRLGAILIGLSALAQSAKPASAASLYLAWRGPGADDGIYAMRTTDVEAKRTRRFVVPASRQGNRDRRLAHQLPKQGLHGLERRERRRHHLLVAAEFDGCLRRVGAAAPTERPRHGGSAGHHSLQRHHSHGVAGREGRPRHILEPDRRNELDSAAGDPGIGTDADQSYVPRPGSLSSMGWFTWPGAELTTTTTSTGRRTTASGGTARPSSAA